MTRLYLLPLIVVRTPRQLDALATQTYVLAAVVAVAAIMLAIGISSAIKFEGGARPSDPGKRRMAFWIVLVLAVTLFFLYNLYFAAPTISPNLQTRFMKTNVIALGAAAVIYLIGGFAISKAFSKGKLGSWFGSR